MSRQFELHSRMALSSTTHAMNADPFESTTAESGSMPIVITAAAGLLWIDLLPGQSCTQPNETRTGRYPFGLQVIRQAVGEKLLIITSEKCLVNGLPALPAVVLQTRDILTLPGGVTVAITERVSPHLGRALPEHVGGKCSLCKLPVDEQSFVLECASCGSLYHYETEETAPEIPAEDRCDCGVQLRACVACSQRLSTESRLEWDPTEL